MPLVELRDVCRHYQTANRRQDVLRGATLDVEAGAFVAIVGPSGCGKSTILNLLGGLDRASSGEVVVDGVDLTRAPGSVLDEHRRHRVGFVFQSFHVNPRRTALENVLLPLVFAPPSDGSGPAMARARLAEVGLADVADRPAATLSGGQRQRVAIARALVRSPRLLLADEPVGDLDAVTGREIVALMRRINREQGVTVVAVSHDLLLLETADRTFQVDGGRLREASPSGRTIAPS